MQYELIIEKIKESNHDAICNRTRVITSSYPTGMAMLINKIHNYNASLDVWEPKTENLAFDITLLNLYRGAFARNQIGQELASGPRGATAIYKIFTNKKINNAANSILQAGGQSITRIDNFTCDRDIIKESKVFWNLCVDYEISTIYIAKTLSMLCPDLFVPFDTASCRRINNYRRDLPRNDSFDWAAACSAIDWERYISLHKHLKIQINNLKEMHSMEKLRMLSFSSDCTKCSNEFVNISQDITSSPPAISRFIDKIFYTPRAIDI